MLEAGMDREVGGPVTDGLWVCRVAVANADGGKREVGEVVGGLPTRGSASTLGPEKEREKEGTEAVDGGGGEGDGLDLSSLEISSLAVGLTRACWSMGAMTRRWTGSTEGWVRCPQGRHASQQVAVVFDRWSLTGVDFEMPLKQVRSCRKITSYARYDKVLEIFFMLEINDATRPAQVDVILV